MTVIHILIFMSLAVTVLHCITQALVTCQSLDLSTSCSPFLFSQRTKAITSAWNIIITALVRCLCVCWFAVHVFCSGPMSVLCCVPLSTVGLACPAVLGVQGILLCIASVFVYLSLGVDAPPLQHCSLHSEFPTVQGAC